LFLTPNWSQLQTSPAALAVLIAMPYLLGIVLEWLYIAGEATF